MPEERVAAVLRGRPGSEARQKGSRAVYGAAGAHPCLRHGCGGRRPRRVPAPGPERAPPPRVYAQTSYLRVPSFGGGSLSGLGLWNTAASCWRAQKKRPGRGAGNADHWASVSIFRWSSSSCFSVT